MVFQHEVISNQKLNAKFNSIVLRSINKNFSFETGQFVPVQIKDDVVRFYSIASNPQKLPAWSMFVDVTPGGPGTTYLKFLKQGQIVKTKEPTGRFLLSENDDSFIFGATGCGIAPILPMIEKLTSSHSKKVTLIWGLRFNRDIALTKILDSFKKNNPNFNYEIVLSKPDKNWPGKNGHAVSPILEKAQSSDPAKTGIYLSGSGEFIRDSASALARKKFPINKIYFEACY